MYPYFNFFKKFILKHFVLCLTSISEAVFCLVYGTSTVFKISVIISSEVKLFASAS